MNIYVFISAFLCVFVCSVPATVHHICWCVLPIQFKPLRWLRMRPQMNIERTHKSRIHHWNDRKTANEHNVNRGVVERHKVDDTKRTRHLVNCENLSWVVRVYIYNVRACVCGVLVGVGANTTWSWCLCVCVCVCWSPLNRRMKLWRMQTNYFIKLEKQRKVFN